MKISKYLLIVSLFAVFGARSQAAIITVGDHDIAPNTITDIQILIEREATDPDVVGLTLALQVTDGTTLAGPAIESVDLINGTIFAANNDGGFDNGAAVDPPQHAFWEVVTGDLTAIPIPPNGVLATVRIDATGFTERATYNLTASSFIANSSTVESFLFLIDINDDIVEVTSTVNDGTITITPEPATFALWAIPGVLALSLKRHKR